MVDKTRAPRTTETREAEARPILWTPPSLLPDPEPQEGFKFRWIRTAINGQSDPANVSYRYREGWIPCKREDHPELAHLSDVNSKNPENIESGGLLLCKMPIEVVEARNNHYRNVTKTQMDAVDNSYMRESDSRMPMLKPERSSKVTFGRGVK
ncbi:MAG: hypothetical protein JW384_04289 [Nitrosomonadaceae bacterium]|nr:hypothetical protein [Nitrosomonadaceae bacterium]